MKERVYTVYCPFGGVGGGGKGFQSAFAELFGVRGRFVCTGGIDFDKNRCIDFEYLTGVPEACVDVSTMTVEDWIRVAGEEAPDVVFSSPPCKSFSKLLSNAKSTEAKYTDMSKLALKMTELMLAAWEKKLPRLLIYENVPAIASRGKWLLTKLRKMLRDAGYVLQDGFHECGEVGGLGQRRKRWFLVARLEASVPHFLYKPPKKRIRGCGEVLRELPMPCDSKGGPMHGLPALSALNWWRLWKIPAGGDWRDLIEDGKPRRERFRRHHVAKWTEPSVTIAGSGSNGPCGVADPRFDGNIDLGMKMRENAHANHYVVAPFDAPVPTITGASRPGSGAISVADSRVAGVQLGFDAAPFGGAMGVVSSDAPIPTITGGAYPSNGAYSVQDVRIPGFVPQAGNENMHIGKYHVMAWDDAAKTVTTATRIGSGAPSVADVRVQGFRGAYGVLSADEPSSTVTGNGRPAAGPFSWAAPAPVSLVPRCKAYDHAYAVLAKIEPAYTIAATSDVGCGAYAVAEERSPSTCAKYGMLPYIEAAKALSGKDGFGAGPFAIVDSESLEPTAIIESWDKPPFVLVEKRDAKGRVMKDRQGRVKFQKRDVPLVLISADGTWHRPLTTLELAVLQGFPWWHRGSALVFQGGATEQREAIGNAVPPPVAMAIGEQMLLCLIAADEQAFYLNPSDGAVWVDPAKPWALGEAPLILDDGAVRPRKCLAAKKKARAPKSRSGTTAETVAESMN